MNLQTTLSEIFSTPSESQSQKKNENSKKPVTKKRASFNILNKDHSLKEVQGYVLGAFGIHRPAPNNGYSVIHLRTGMHVGIEYPLLKNAHSAVAQLMAMKINWHDIDRPIQDREIVEACVKIVLGNGGFFGT